MAVRSPDPHNLRAASRTAAVIEFDRECSGCRYNLRGLRMGSRCPECGLVVGSSSEIDDPLSLAPTHVIVAFIRGCWAASIIIALTVALMLAPRWPDWNSDITRWGLVALSILWIGAVMWLTPAFSIPQAVLRGFSRRGRLRIAARWLQLGWIVAAVMRLILHDVSMSAGVKSAAQMALGAAGLAGLAGVVVLAILLERLSEWARDDTAQLMFNWSMWTIPLTTGLLLIDMPMTALAVMLGAVWLVGVGMFPWGLISLSGSVTLSVVHAHEHRQREQRRSERARKHADQVERTVRVMDDERARRGNVM